MEPTPQLPDAALARIEALVQQSRQTILEGVEQLLLREVDPLLGPTRQMLLERTEAILRQQAEPMLGRIRQLLLETLAEMAHRQLEPLVDRTRQMIMLVVEDTIQRHASPLVGQLRTALQQMLEEVVPRQMEPLLERARAGMQESAQLATQVTDAMVGRLKVTVAEPAAEMVREQVPVYAHAAGRRLLDYVLAATLFSLTAIFLLIGVVLGLQQAGLPPFATYILGGLAALGGGLLFLRLSSRPWTKPVDKGP
jgi:hypothetical protein